MGNRPGKAWITLKLAIKDIADKITIEEMYEEGYKDGLEGGSWPITKPKDDLDRAYDQGMLDGAADRELEGR